jgi:hypothetical protein
VRVPIVTNCREEVFSETCPLIGSNSLGPRRQSSRGGVMLPPVVGASRLERGHECMLLG